MRRMMTRSFLQRAGYSANTIFNLTIFIPGGNIRMHVICNTSREREQLYIVIAKLVNTPLPLHSFPLPLLTAVKQSILNKI